MPNLPSRSTPRRLVCLALAGMATLATVHGALAEDGISGFLSSIFGGNNAVQQPVAPSTPAYVRSYAQPSNYQRARLRPYLRVVHFQQRPIMVRLRRAATKLLVAQSPIKPRVVSIYEDRTLRRGDAVMTADGVRIFAGSTSWPYAAGDFVALAKAKDLSKDTTKVLAEVDRLPRG